MTDKDMYKSIKEQMTDDGRYYLLLDEVQEIDGWEKAVNSLLENMDTDIYVTGSNSKLMTGEISTYLTGRYISIPVYTCLLYTSPTSSCMLKLICRTISSSAGTYSLEIV